jgi:hypothetical protein
MGLAKKHGRGSFKGTRQKQQGVEAYDTQSTITYLVRDLSGGRRTNKTKHYAGFKRITSYGPHAVPPLLKLIEDYPVVCGAALEELTGMAPEAPKRLSEVADYWLGLDALDLLCKAAERVLEAPTEEEEVSLLAA